MKIARLAFGVVAVLLVCGSLARAQSLADVARKEEERRKGLKTPSKVITTDDLKKYPAPPPPATTEGAPPAADAPPGQQGQQGQQAAQAADKPAEAAEAKDEAYWKGRMTAAREQLDRNKQFLDALQSQVNALTNDFYARDDPAQRAQLWDQRIKALEQMERLKKEIADGDKAIADIQEEARRAGVPPGWLR